MSAEKPPAYFTYEQQEAQQSGGFNQGPPPPGGWNQGQYYPKIAQEA